MSENVLVQETLKQIFENLGKLVAIWEQSVNNLQDILLKLQARTHALEGFQVSGTKDIGEL